MMTHDENLRNFIDLCIKRRRTCIHHSILKHRYSVTIFFLLIIVLKDIFLFPRMCAKDQCRKHAKIRRKFFDFDHFIFNCSFLNLAQQMLLETVKQLLF